MSDDWGEPPSITDDDWGEPPSSTLPSRDIRPLAKQRLDRLKAGGSPPETSGPVGQLTPELNTVFDAVAGANDKLDQFAQGQVDTKRRLQQEREAALRRGNITGQDPRLAAIPTPKPRSGLEPLFDRRQTPEGYDPEQDKPGALTAIAATVRAALGGAGAISPDATPIARARLRPQVEPGGGVRLPPQPEPAPPIPMRMPPDLRSKAAERLAALRAQEPQAPNVQPLFAGKGLGEAPETTYPTYFAPPSALVGASAPVQAYRGASEWMHGASADFGRWATESPDSALARVIDAGQKSDSDLAQLAAGVTKGGVQVAAEVAPTVAEFAALNALVPGGGIGAAVHAGTKVYFAKDGVEMLTQAAKDAPGVMERGDPNEIGRALASTAMAVGMIAPAAGVGRDIRDARFLREHPELSRDSPQLQADVADYTSPRSVNNRGMDAALAALRAERQAASVPPPVVEQPTVPSPPDPAAAVDPAQLASHLAAAEKMLAEPDLAPEIKAKVGAVAEKIRAQLASTQPAEIPQNAPGGAEQGGMQPASFPVPPDVKLGLARRLAAQRGVDAGPAPVQPPPAAPRPAEPAPAGPAPAEVQPEPVGRPSVAPARPYDEVQRDIDAVEENLSGQGVDVTKLGPAADIAAGRLPPDWKPMPPELEKLYEERDAVQAGDDTLVNSEVGSRLASVVSDPGARGKLTGRLTETDKPAGIRAGAMRAIDHNEPARLANEALSFAAKTTGDTGFSHVAGAPHGGPTGYRLTAEDGGPGAPHYSEKTFASAQRILDAALGDGAVKIPSPYDVSRKSTPVKALVEPRSERLAPESKEQLDAQLAAVGPVTFRTEQAGREQAEAIGMKTLPGTSSYVVNEGGGTTRTKGLHAGHDAGDVGEKKPSERTVYVDPESAHAIGALASLQGGGRHAVVERDGRLYPVTWNERDGRWGISPGDRAGWPIVADSPSVGLHPVELWKGKDGPQGREWGGSHAGSRIVEVSGGSKPGVFYPVQNGHEVPDTPAGLARVNGEQGSLIFDPKRVPVEKAQRAVDTGENLHEVIGMSGPREGDVAVTTRDARGVPITDEQTADVPRAVAAATPPEGGSVEVRPLAAVIEERQQETLAERKRRMEAEMQATNADLRGLDGLKAIIKEVDPATKMRLLQKAIPDAPPRTKQWAYDELERVRQAEAADLAPTPGGAPDLAPAPERKANVRADELVTKVLGDNIGAMRRQAAMGAIDELAAGRPATKGVFTLPEENAIRSELGLPARKLAPGKAGVATAPKLRGGKSLGAGAGGAGGTGPDPDLLGSRVLHALTGIKDVFRKTPGGEAPVGESVADAPAPPPAPKTGRIWDNISEVASFRNRWGSIAQNVLAELDPKAFHFVREAEAARSTAAQAVVIAKARVLRVAKAHLKESGLKGRSLDLAAQTMADDGMTYLENSRNFGLNRRWRDLKEKVEGMTDEKLLEAADSHVIKIPIEALSRKSIFEGEDLTGNLAKAVKAGDAKAVRELVTTAYRDAIDAYAPREFSDSTETLESMHEKPWIREMRDAWADGPGKLLAKVHGENPAKPGSFIPEEYMGPSKTYFPGIEADARNKTRAFERPTYGIQSNIDNHFATGISDTGYSHEVKDLVDSIGHSVVANGRASTLEQLKKTGIARPLMKGEKASDTEPMEFGGRLVKTVAIATKAAYRIAKDGTIQKAMDVQHYVIPDQINRELAPVFEKSKIDQKGLAKIATDIQNSTQMAGITDLAYHSINIFNVGLQDAPMIARYLGGELKAAETFSDMLKIITGGDLTEAGNQARLTRMADNGQLSPRAFQSTFDSAQAEYLGIGNSLGFRKGIDPHTGKMKYNVLGFNLEPWLSGTGRGADFAIDTRARLLLDKVGEYIFERSNPGKKWADHPHEQFMWTKQLGVYHSGIEGEWIRVMKDVPILGRVGPFMTAATTMTKGGVAGLVGGTLHMPVKPGDQMFNRWRAYGVTAGLVVPVAAWVLAYKNATGKMPWEDPDSEPGRVPVSKEFRESAIGKKLFGNDLTKAGTIDMWRFSLAKRGFRAIGGFGAIRQAREGGSAKDIFFGAATDAINDWSHGMAGPSVHNMMTLLTGHEPRFKYDARVGHPTLVEAYRGKGSAGRNIKKAAEGLNPIIKNAFESREKEKSLGRSLLDSAGVGSMFGTARPRMDKMQKLLSLKRPIIERQLEPEKLAEYDYIRKTTAALRHGEDKEKVMADLREKVKAGFIGEGKAKDIVEAAAMPDWYDDFEGANVEDAADAWLVATPEQRKRLGGVFGKKVKHWQGLATQKSLSSIDRDRIKAKIAKAVASATP